MKPIALLFLCACALPQVREHDVRSVEWQLSRISYWRDYSKEDEWRPCDKTMELGYGDCEDFAICAQELVKDWEGCASSILIYRNTRGRHAVLALGCENGIRGHFDNGVWVEGNYKKALDTQAVIVAY